MPTVDFETHIVSRFQCPKPADAAPGNKAQHQLARVHDSQAPHCVVDLVIGTRGAFVTRTDAHGYEMHVPDAPVMLGPDRLKAYAAAAKTLGNSPYRMRALACGAAVGACVGFMFGTAIFGALYAAHVLLPASVGHVGTALWLYLGVTQGALVSGVLTRMDLQDYRRAADKVDALTQMAKAGIELSKARLTLQDVADTKKLARLHENSAHWEIQQAAFELKAMASAKDPLWLSKLVEK